MDQFKIEVVIRMVDPTTGRKRTIMIDPNYKVPRVFAHHLLHTAILRGAARFAHSVLKRLEGSTSTK